MITPFPTISRLFLLTVLICAVFPAMAADDNYLATVNAEAAKLSTTAVTLRRSTKARADALKTRDTTSTLSIASKSIVSQPAFEHYLTRHLRASYHYYRQLKKIDRQRVFNTAVATRSIPSVRRRIIDLYLASER